MYDAANSMRGSTFGLGSWPSRVQGQWWTVFRTMEPGCGIFGFLLHLRCLTACLKSWFILGSVLVFGNKRRNWGITKLWGMTFATLETISGPRVIRARMTNIGVGST